MPIVIGAREDAQDGRVSSTISSFTTSFEGSIGSTADTDGALQRAMGSFQSRLNGSTTGDLSAGWPQNGWAMYGGYMISAQGEQFSDDPTGLPKKTWNEEKDILVIQGLGWRNDNLLDEAANRFKQFKDNNPNSKLLYYFLPSEPTKPDQLGSSIVGYNDEVYEMITDADRGDSQTWYLRNDAGELVESQFDPSRLHHANCYAIQFTSNNSFGRNFMEQFLEEHFQQFIKNRPAGKLIDFIDGLYWDACASADERVFVDGSDGATETNRDFDQDQNPDGRYSETIPADPTNEGGYGGARMYRRGTAQAFDIYKGLFGTDKALTRNGTPDGIQYDIGGFASGDPINTSEFYQKWDGNIHEGIGKDLGTDDNGTDYDIDFNGFDTGVKRHLWLRNNVTPASQHIWGPKGYYATLMVVTMNTRATEEEITQTDYEYARFYAGIAALCGSCHAPFMSRRDPFPRLDEQIYVWGEATDADYPDRMGTLDPTSSGMNVTLRALDFDSGGVKAYWQEFDNVLWVVRKDAPSTGAGNFNTGTAQSITLPSAGAGKKWQFPDFASTAYTNPNTGWQTRNQSPSINDGSDAGSSISLKPWTARMLIRVNS